jgi:hypothetical protein
MKLLRLLLCLVLVTLPLRAEDGEELGWVESQVQSIKQSLVETGQWVIEKLVSWALFLMEKMRQFGEFILESFFDALELLLPTVDLSPVEATLGMANSVFPLAETISYLLTLFAWWLLVLAYRFVKSLIPTVSGT